MKGRLIAVVILTVLTSIVLGATVFREQVANAAPGIQDVFVTNSTREPVPVHEQGTADVSVTNTPLGVHEQGTADVSVTNTPLGVHEQGTANVSVTNAPLAVRVSGEQPVQRELVWDLSSSCDSDGEIATYSVPAGKYLRIEQVTIAGHGSASQFVVFNVGTVANGFFVRHFLDPRSTVSPLLRIYADPGTNALFFFRTNSCGGIWRGSFSGVLIDAS